MHDLTRPPARLTFITGPSRSGKTRLALKLALSYPEPRAYLATAQGLDYEMALRIRRHQEEREGNFETIEEPMKLSRALSSLNRPFSVVIIDCLTLWLSNLMGKWGQEEARSTGRPSRQWNFLRLFQCLRWLLPMKWAGNRPG